MPLQTEIQNKIKAVLNVIDMLSKIIKVDDSIKGDPTLEELAKKNDVSRPSFSYEILSADCLFFRRLSSKNRTVPPKIVVLVRDASKNCLDPGRCAVLLTPEN